MLMSKEWCIRVLRVFRTCVGVRRFAEAQHAYGMASHMGRRGGTLGDALPMMEFRALMRRVSRAPKIQGVREGDLRLKRVTGGAPHGAVVGEVLQ